MQNPPDIIYSNIIIMAVCCAIIKTCMYNGIHMAVTVIDRIRASAGASLRVQESLNHRITLKIHYHLIMKLKN